MSQEDKLVRVRQKSDTAENWILNNPILLYGELGLETDTCLIKIGDGVTPWTGLPYVLKNEIDNKANKDLSNVSSLTETVKNTLGVAPKAHNSSNTTYGVGTTNSYGHVRTSGITGGGHYVQSRRENGIGSNLNSTSYLYAGHHPIGFYINATGVPATISNDTGVTSTSTMIYGVIETENYYNNGTNYSSTYGVKQTLVIPRYGLTYERYNYQGSDTFGNWEKLEKFQMPEDINCNTINATTATIDNINANVNAITIDSNLSVNGLIKGFGDAEFLGYNTSTSEEAVYATGPLTAPLYVGTIHANWIFDDWANNSRSPQIELIDNDREIKYAGYLTEKFSSEEYDIIISLDDSTMSNYYSSIAECGLYVKSDGTMGIGNPNAFDNSDLRQNKVNLGVNITIYYTGGGVL